MTRDLCLQIAAAVYGLDDRNRAFALALLLAHADLVDDDYVRGLVAGMMTKRFLSARRRTPTEMN